MGMSRFKNVTVGDAEKLWDTMRQLDVETSFMMYGTPV